ncbi:MAG: HAMP domain-containing histidine kinase [Ruminococcaceae bacterium]|nr:HAMP domain-containing histidine kinase [Oscillospiraceae bacterium]
MKKEERKNRFSLTITFSLVVFAVLFISVGLAMVIVYLLTELGAITAYDGSEVEIMPFLALMAVISLIIGFSIAILTLKFPLIPINRTITQMNKLASGDFSARLTFGKTVSTHPAFRELSESFNKMATDLGSTEMLRQDFINNFSHEFKTPIVSIAGFAKLLKRGNLTDEQKKEYISIIEEESLRLSYMANNVLNLTKVENQAILSETSTYNLSEQLRSCVLLLENKWSGKNIEFSLEFDEYNINANEELLKQVWINLIDNAIKFSDEDSVVTIKILETQEEISVSITNSGVCISKEHISKIFNKFYQADESHSSEGNGVGLAIVKRVAELHQGRVGVESENGITTLTVTIPK